MPFLKRKTFSGAVLEQEIYYVSERTKNLKNAAPRLVPPKTAEEKERLNRQQSCKRLIRLVNSNFTPSGYYVTLTYDEEHLPPTISEAKRELEKYIRRLKYISNTVKIIAVTGYGKRSGRIHHHAIIEGIEKKYIPDKWICGSVVRVEHLRKHNFYNGIDRGQDYTSLATYLFHHWTKEQGGKRWKQTRSIRQPDKEPPKIIKKHYSFEKPPITPKGYILVEKRENPYFCGYLCFRYVKKPKTDKLLQ